MQKVDREIESLRAAVADKINPTKLVETRLETRTRRPVLERVQVIIDLIVASNSEISSAMLSSPKEFYSISAVL